MMMAVVGDSCRGDCHLPMAIYWAPFGLWAYAHGTGLI